MLGSAGKKAEHNYRVARSGYVEQSSWNVEDFFGVGLVTKGIFASITKGLAKGAGRAFWTGAGTEAEALAKGFQTLGQTRAGKNLAKLTADMPYFPGSQAYKMWARLSTQYAKVAKGTIHVFQNAKDGVNLQSIWRLYEFPTLLNNTKLTGIKYHY